MSGSALKRKIPDSLREALWLAHGSRCAYTSEPLAYRDLHIDHILPDRLENAPQERARLLAECRVPDSFDLQGPMNLLPVRGRANLQKGGKPFSPSRTVFFLEIAERKAPAVANHLRRIERRRDEDNVRIQLVRFRDDGTLSDERFAVMLQALQAGDVPPFELLAQLHFVDAESVSSIEPSDMDELRDREVQLGANSHLSGVELTHANLGKTTVYTCREYDQALANGYFPYSTFDIKMAAFFVHQCGLLKALGSAKTPTVTYLDGPPRRGITDLGLIPYDLFPHTMEGSRRQSHPGVSFQDKVNDGTLVVSRVGQNLLTVQNSGLSLTLIEAARADFTGDGVEDMLIFRYDDYKGGTLGVGSIALLSCTSQACLFDVAVGWLNNDCFDPLL